MDDQDLSGLVAARLCHDLVNPVGAVQNGLDLVAEIAGPSVAAEMEMIAQSALRAATVLRLSRLAFGRVPDSASQTRRGEFAELMSSMLAGPRVSLEWRWDDGAELPPGMARVLALTFLCARASLGLQGIIRCETSPRQDAPVTVSAIGPNAALPEGAPGWMGDGNGAPPPEPRHVEFALIRGACEEAGLTIETATEPGTVRFRIDRR